MFKWWADSIFGVPNLPNPGWGISECDVSADKTSVVSADKTSAVSADKTSVVSANRTSVVSADISQDIPQALWTEGWPLRGRPSVQNVGGMSWEMSADTTDVLSADTTDVLSADTTDVLSADTADCLLYTSPSPRD